MDQTVLIPRIPVWRAVLLAASAGIGLCCVSLALDPASATATEGEPDGSSLVAEMPAIDTPAGVADVATVARELPVPAPDTIPEPPVPAPATDVVETVEPVPAVAVPVIEDAVTEVSVPVAPLDPSLFPPIDLPLPIAVDVPIVGVIHPAPPVEESAAVRIPAAVTTDAATADPSLGARAAPAADDVRAIDAPAPVTTASAPDAPDRRVPPNPHPTEPTPGQPRSASGSPISTPSAVAELAGGHLPHTARGTDVPPAGAATCPSSPAFDPGSTPD